MSDWNRSDRDDGYGEYGGRRRELGGRDRWSERNGYGAERRSFDEGGVAYGDDYAQGGQRDQWRSQQAPGWAPRSEGYGGRGYGRQDYGGRQAYAGQGYAGGESGGHGWRGASYERGMGGDYGRGYGYQRERGYGAGGAYGGQTADPYTQRVADGNFGGWRENIDEGRGRDDERRTGEHRGRGPKSYTRSDERIREDVNDRLTDDHRLDASEIEVAVKDGEVTLSGTVKSREDKRRAEDIAEDVSGVKHVQCNLRVQQQQGQGQIGEHGARATPGGGMAAQGRTAGTA